MIDRLKDPIFFIGFPRSGTTIIFEAFVRNPEFGWLANYAEMWPRAIAANILCRLLDNRLVRLRGHKKQYGSVRFGNRYLPQPVEAYAFWDHYTGIDFSRDYLLGQTADDASRHNVHKALQKTMRYQGKTHFATKLTGPGRIEYLLSIFPDARFVHVIRDGRAAVESLLRVEFWRNKGGLDAPFWMNGLESESIDDWEMSGKDPVVLAAHQWKRIIGTTLDEAQSMAQGQYAEVKYEDFVVSAQTQTSRLLSWAGLNVDDSRAQVETSGAGLDDMNQKYLQVLSREKVADMNRIMGPMLDRLGYTI
jgi:Sulfotransferase family